MRPPCPPNSRRRTPYLLAFALALVAFTILGAPRAEAQADAAFARAVAAIAQRQAVDDSIAVPGARSILLTHATRTPRAIMLLHGLTDSPRQFEALAHQLYADGNNVYVPRLPEHGLRGGNAHSLGALTATALRNVADALVRETEGLGDSIVVVGMSMGGTVASWIVQEHRVARVVLIAPAIAPGRLPSRLDRPLVGLADHLPSMTRRTATDSTRPDREIGFNSHAAAAIFQLGELIASRADKTASGTRAVSILVNASDRTVSSSAAMALARNWFRHGTSVSVFQIPDSLRLPHNIIDPRGKPKAGEAVLSLLRDLAYGALPGPIVRAMAVR